MAALIFISGGVRSGKSSYAENIALSLGAAANAPLYYLATSPVNGDRELQERIHYHRSERDQSWQTLEEVYHIDHSLALLPAGAVVLLDCLTIWMSTAIFQEQASLQDILDKLEQLIKNAASREQTLLIVSNDLNEALPIPCEMTQHYIYCLERSHDFLIRHAQWVIQTIAGIPCFWKGEPL